LTNNLTYSQEGGKYVDGATTQSYYTLGHELYHAYQDDIGKDVGNREVGAVQFENYLRDVFGVADKRERYGGSKLSGSLSLGMGNEKRVNPGSVQVFIIVTPGTDNSSPEGEGGTMPRDNVNNGTSIQGIISNVMEYMNESGVNRVRLNFSDND
jgi:hypothetical protein